jgi:hypothetical protein
MDFVGTYLNKHQFRPEIEYPVHPDLNICIVIPCFNEPDLLRSLQSLYDCGRPVHATEVVVVVNSPENSVNAILERNFVTLRDASEWISRHNHSEMRFHLIHQPNLPQKFAGVGMARKIGMDEAAYRLNKAKNKYGIITGFDADSVCDKNYLVEIERHFKMFPKTPGASIYFEHPVSGKEFEENIYKGIALYELHLRYLKQALNYAGHPHAFHTVGSSFAVRMKAYAEQGGMNKNKAGEDFYFLQKIISLGNYTEINSTRVIPSPRLSDRVPFGTGASMHHWEKEQILETYSLNAFIDIKQLINNLDNFYNVDAIIITRNLNVLPKPLQEFLQMNDFLSALALLISNTSSLQAFRKRFFRWFNAFRVIKYLNYTANNIYKKGEVTLEAKRLNTERGIQNISDDLLGLLDFYRNTDRTLYRNE